MTPRALVVDDDPVSARMVSKLLAHLGCESVVCTRPFEVVELALREQVDLVCLDLTMPELDGYQVLTLLRSHEHTLRAGSVPVVAITGRALPEDRATSLAMGFAAHIGKPVMLDALQQALAISLTLRSELAQNRFAEDLEAIEARVDALCQEPGADRMRVAAGLALAVEQQGREHLGRALVLAFNGDTEGARGQLQLLLALAGALGSVTLQTLCRQLADAVEGDGSTLQLAAVLARAEFDRVIYTLRHRVLG